MVSFIEPTRWIPLLKRIKILRDIMLMFKISAKFPIFLLVEPTNDCNLDCYFCPRKTSRRMVGYMDFDLYKRIIDESVKFGKRMMLGLQKDGEPLLHPSILEMIKYAKDKSASYVLHLATNGLVLDEEMAIGILNSGLDDLLISIDAAKTETYKKIKGRDSLHQVEMNVHRFLQLKEKIKSKKPFVRVKLVKTDHNIEELELFRQKWKGLVDWVEITEFFQWGDMVNIDSGITNNLSRYPCLFPWYWPAINWNGTVSVCCYDYDSEGIMGNLYEDTLFNIWRSSNFQDIRYAHLSGIYEKIPICAKCRPRSMSPNIGNWLRKSFLHNQANR